MTYKTKLFLFILIFFVAILHVACENNQLAGVSESISTVGWASKDEVILDFIVNDTASTANFYINIRHTNDYPYSNLYVFLTTYFPNQKKSVDTINCPMAGANGKWYGRGIGGTFDNKILYQTRKKLPLSGNYKVHIQQGMRDTILPGILDVGINIEKTDN